MSRLLCVFALLATAFVGSPVYAQDYVYRDGFYWLNGNAYQRTLVSVPGSYYCSHGCWYQYPSSSYYTYTQVAVVTQQTEVPKYEKGWQTAIANAAAAKADYAAFQKALTTVFPEYTTGVTASANVYTGGQTAYGYVPYTYQTVKEAYGSLDINQLYQAAARLASSAQQYGSQATSEHAGLVQQAGDNAAHVAEIHAKKEAILALARAIAPEPSTKTTTTVQSGTIQDASGVQNVQVPVPADPAFVANVISPNCASCHSATTPGGPKAKLDLTKWSTLSEETKDEARRRILLPVTDKDHMPPAKNGQAVVVSPKHAREFLLH